MLDTTSFIGREKERAEIQQRLTQPECRLLTLVGPGGIGKTRLALQLASVLGAEFKHGSFIAYLQPIHSAEFFLPAVADALDAALSGHESPLEQLSRYLEGKEALIIIDNFEHLLDAADQLSELLATTPSIKCLVTSREALNLQEEWLYPISGLLYSTTSSDLVDQNNDAVHLFNERVKRSYSKFEPELEAEAVVRICQLVEGMPLALELAAAWRKTLNCQEIADEINGGLDFLTARHRNVAKRHRSIQTVFDQTWQRLSEREQTVFRQLSVFRGGFQRDAVVKITGASLAILSTLVDKSLLYLDSDGRYKIHELLRQYGAEQLEKNTEGAQHAQMAHADFYTNFLYELRNDLYGHHQQKAEKAIKAELDNIRAAWMWIVAKGDTVSIDKVAYLLGFHFQFTGGYREGYTLISLATKVLQRQPPSNAVDHALLNTLLVEAFLSLRLGEIDTVLSCIAQCQEIYRRLNIPNLPGYVTDPLGSLTFAALAGGDYTNALRQAEHMRICAEKEHHPINRQFAYHLLSEAHAGLGAYKEAQQFAQLAYAQSLMTGDRWFRAYILNNMGQIAVTLGEDRVGKAHFQASYQIRHEFADPEGMALALINLGNLSLKEGTLDEAKTQFQRSRKIYQNINDKGGLAAATWGLGQVMFAQDDVAQAQRYYKDALQVAISIGYQPVLLGLLVSIAELLWEIGQQKRAIVLLTFAIHSPTTDHETQQKAQSLLAKTIQKNISSTLLATATVKGKASKLTVLTTDTLNQLSLPFVTAASEASPRSTPIDALVETLTARELDVLRLICAGQTNNEIANNLGIATGTVKFYTSQVYGKLSVRNRVSAVARAQTLNLI